MGINYGSLQCTFYRDFERRKEINPTNAIGGPITFSRNSTGTYIGSNGYLQTASVNEPRFGYEYDSNDNLVYKGLLIESFKNNVFLHSEDFSQSVWTKTSSTISSSSVLSPDGINNAQKLSISSSGGNVSQSYTTGYVSTNTGYRRCFHLSVMVKADECSYLNIKIENGTDSLSCYFNLTNATTGSNDSNSNYLEYTYKHIMRMGNGWYRCFLCVKDDNFITNKTYTVTYTPTTSSNSITGSSGDGLYIWGAMTMHESNISYAYQATARSYVKTTTNVVFLTHDSFYVNTNYLGTYGNDKLSLFGQFSMPLNNFKVGIISSFMAIQPSSTTCQFRQSNSTGNITFRKSGQASYDYGSFSILDDDNKGIITYQAGLGSKACMNNGPVYSANSAANSTYTSTIGSIALNPDAFYKKIFCVPTILSDRHMKALTVL